MRRRREEEEATQAEQARLRQEQLAKASNVKSINNDVNTKESDDVRKN